MFVFNYVLFCRDGPLLVIASGRDTISIASSIKRLASENVFVIQVCCNNIFVNFASAFY